VKLQVLSIGAVPDSIALVAKFLVKYWWAGAVCSQQGLLEVRAHT